MQTILKKAIAIIENKNKNDNEKYFQLGELFKNNQNNFRGHNLLKELSENLNKKYDKGYSYSNLTAMQRYYEKFKTNPELKELSFKVAWNQINELLKIYDPEETKFYLKRAIQNNWSLTKIKKAIENDEYGKYIAKVENSNYKFELEKVYINNFKSLINVNIINPSHFSVFVGANASGKSNIFEALELMFHSMYIAENGAIEIFGGKDKILNFNTPDSALDIELLFKDKTNFGINFYNNKLKRFTSESEILNKKFINSFSRIFFDNTKKGINKLKIHNKLWFDGSNLSKILKNILFDESKRDESKKEAFLEQLINYIPGLKDIKITNELDGTLKIQIIEHNLNRPVSGLLISEGTYSIIGLLTLLYQSDGPQFLCIEEPENGLNPKVQKDIVELFRNVCKDEGHYIWLTTHSQSIVAELKPQELIIVDKIEGKTTIKQFNNDIKLIENYENGKIKMDEAWLNNKLRGGLPW